MEDDMEYVTLGRTGLRVSAMGLGCGGPSRVGRATGKSEAEQIAIIRQALDAGINFIDTAEVYQTEAVVGRAIKGLDRDKVVLSTKKSTWGAPVTPQDVRESLDASLKRLEVDYVDIYHLHGVLRHDYEHLLTEIVPTLQELRDRGRLRFIGITEQGNADPGHRMLQRALRDDVWDVMMVMFNLLNQSARERVLAKTQEKGVGTLVMFAVRLALSRPERLREVIGKLIENGQLDPGEIDMQDLLGFLIGVGGAVSVPDAAYRFCRDEPGTDVVLVGTGDPDHLRANIASFARPPLPEETVRRLKYIFRRVDSVSGQ
jgi:aryl-alcohol dehydrogenase-like predicted oxidoreductase